MKRDKIAIYVDDDEDDRMLLSEAFASKEGYRLVALQSGQELFNYLDKEPEEVSLIILDINMPVQNGVEVLQQLREHPLYKDIPCVMFSTAGRSPQTKTILELGSDIVVKPTSFAELEATSYRLLDFCQGMEQ